MKKEVKELDKVIVTNLNELKQALIPFQSDTTIKKLLLEGMDMAKRQAEFTKTRDVNKDEFGGYFPAKPASGLHYLWVDTLIERRLGGKRDGTKITWKLPEGDFAFDPWTTQLEQINADSH